MYKFNYSPSLLHNHLLESMKPALTYQDGDVLSWQKSLRNKLKELLGDLPDTKYPLNVRTLWQKEIKLGYIEKIVFTSEPFCDVPAYICLPHNASKPYRTFICLQGHSTGMHNSIGVDFATNNESISVPGDRDFGLECMRRGIAALCIEQRSMGERRENTQESKAEQMCHDAVCHSLALGRTLTGERIWDIERALDYLNERGDINMRQIGLMGNSGGGVLTIYASAILDRIIYAMPSCAFCTFGDSIMNIYHCADNYIPGLLKYAEAADIMGLHAPHPVVIVAGKKDKLFPIDAVKKAFVNLKNIYKAFGAEENCRLVIGEEGHRFYADQAWEAMHELINRNNVDI